jgi:hypothetical protein
MSNRRSNEVIEQLRLHSADFAGRDGEQDRLSRLTRTIEGEIVPRLLMSFSQANRAADPVTAAISPPCDHDVAELARLLLMRERATADTYVQIIRDQGIPLERICADLLAPVARRLGELWEQDACGYAELTAGLNRLESVLRDVRDEMSAG